MYFSSWLLRILRYGFPHMAPSRNSSLFGSMPLIMKSRLMPYSALAVTSLRVAPFRFHSPYSAIYPIFTEHGRHPEPAFSAIGCTHWLYDPVQIAFLSLNSNINQ